MIFDTSVKQIESSEELEIYLKENTKVVVCAGRWGPMCIPVYKEMEILIGLDKYKDVCFLVINFDTPSAMKIKREKLCRGFRGLPFTVYYKNGESVHATSSIQSRKQLEDNISKHLG